MKKIILCIIILNILILSGCENKNIYVENKKDILQFITDSDYIDNKEGLSIIDTVNVGDIKIVGISTNYGAGVYIFDKIDNEKYKFREVNYSDFDSIGIYNHLVYGNNSTKYIHILISNGNKVSNVELILNGEMNQSKNIVLGKKSMILFDENEFDSKSDNLKIEFMYFDSNGRQLYNN